MFNKPILPSFLNKEKSNDGVEQAPARPPMNPQMVPQEPVETQGKVDEELQKDQPVTDSETPSVSETSAQEFSDSNSFEKKEEIVHHSIMTRVAPRGQGGSVFSNQPESVSADGIVRGPNLHETRFSDIWFTPENVAYVRDIRTRFALTPIETPDLAEFRHILEQGFTGTSSYAVKFAGDSYRVERVMTNDGVQFNCRKMPTETPEIELLGFSAPIVKHLCSLNKSAGLLLFAGPTGQGKTTSASAIMKRFLDTEGGFLYTIEDPPEMPLGGLYHAKNGGLGLCKQTAVENDQWGACLRSALRSKPRYILVGEIRTPETASMCLVAATSGHLVLSTIHANGVEDALNSLIKYAASTGLDESLVADLLARGILGVIYQRLEGTEQLKLYYETAFANPNTSAADQMRMAIRDGSINLATFMETQNTRLSRGIPMFKE